MIPTAPTINPGIFPKESMHEYGSRCDRRFSSSLARHIYYKYNELEQISLFDN